MIFRSDVKLPEGTSHRHDLTSDSDVYAVGGTASWPLQRTDPSISKHGNGAYCSSLISRGPDPMCFCPNCRYHIANSECNLKFDVISFIHQQKPTIRIQYQSPLHIVGNDIARHKECPMAVPAGLGTSPWRRALWSCRNCHLERN